MATSKNVLAQANEAQKQARADAFNSYAKATKKITEVREACCNFEYFWEEDNDSSIFHISSCIFTDKDGAIINVGKKDGVFAYNMIKTLVEVFGLDTEVTVDTIDEIRKAVADKIAKVYFYERKKDGYSFQEFRKPNAVETAQYNTRANAEKGAQEK